MGAVPPEPSVPRRSPRVIAHRGASAKHPEHTLSAYDAAFRVGADGIECDVRLTADGHLVCIHDRRVNRTSNGKGVVSALELETLAGFDWGSWKQDSSDEPEQPDTDRRGLLTLTRLLESIDTAPRPLDVLIETKHPTRHRGRVEARLVADLDRFGLAGGARADGHRVRVMSFSHLALQRVRRLAPDLDLVYLVELMPLWLRDGSLPKGVTSIGLDLAILKRAPQVVGRQQAHGHEVLVWTVDTEEGVRRCLDAGVDGIITNRPEFVLSLVAAGR